MMTLLILLALSSYAQCLFGLDGADGLTRYRLLPLRGWQILMAKDAAFLVVAMVLTVLIDPLAGFTGSLMVLAIGHDPSVKSPGPQVRWRFSTGAGIGNGVVQLGAMSIAANGVARTSVLLLLPCIALYALSILWYGRRSSKRNNRSKYNVGMRRVVLILTFAAAAFAQDANEIIRRASDRDFTNFENRKNYTYQERTEVREYNTKGKLTKDDVETNEILILEGQPYERLIAKNDHPLSEKEAAKEQKKLDSEVAKRKNQSAAEKAKLEKERLEEQKYLHEFTEAFDFKIVGEEPVSGKPAWVISVTPKPGYKPKMSDARMFTKLRGKVWIDKTEYHWVKAEGEATDTLSFGFFLFRVAPGAKVAFEQVSVNNEVWLPSHISVRADARIALLKKMRAEIDITYREYHKFQADSKIVSESLDPTPKKD